MKLTALKLQRRRLDREERRQRLFRHRDKIEMLRAMVWTYQRLDTADAQAEITRLKAKIRTLEQRIRYIGVIEDETQ